MSERQAALHRLAFALDYADADSARRGAELVRDSVGVLKVGLELFVREGPRAVEIGSALGRDIFLDLKLHDIPATVERAVGSAAALGVRYLTIHAGGGPKMIEAAARRAARESDRLVVLAVTVLTSLDAADLASVGVTDSPGTHAERLARLAVDCGAGGLVCSASEVARLRARLGPKVILVTPGIRPASEVASSAARETATASGPDDQKRVGTPREAIRDGADLLVVGRPIRDAADPRAAARAILDELSEAERERGPA